MTSGVVLEQIVGQPFHRIFRASLDEDLCLTVFELKWVISQQPQVPAGLCNCVHPRQQRRNYIPEEKEKQTHRPDKP